ncbi:glutathione synthase [Photobacterium sanctipauli]|uniref:glutathione synthase n=1 Tax=Photobacterium sanctipauli TaxID=1342794 RepID=A0A2T3NX39_9GAMM|nr:glutathione synthase [Photobacterium sanctipauli]PSW20867.1 glutathione synthase [Photobacterium sanctipauli]
MTSEKNTQVLQSVEGQWLDKQISDEACEWAIMHGVAIKNSDGTARHCPFSIAPMSMKRDVYQHLLKVTPVITKLISHVSEDHGFLQSSLKEMAQADPFFGRLMSLHQQVHGISQCDDHCEEKALPAARQPLLLMRTDYMDDRQQGAKVIEFNGIAAGMGPFGQRAAQLHQYMQNQWPETYADWIEESNATPAENRGLEQLAYGIAVAARKIQAEFNDGGQPTFLMVVQKNEDNVYDQHLLEVEFQRQGVRTVRRTFDQLANQLYSGEANRLMLKGIGAVDVVYLRAGYQYEDYCAPQLREEICCHTLSQTRVFIEQHKVALNATISQQLATSKTMQMLLTMMPEHEFARWGLSIEEAKLVKSVLADMRAINSETIDWFNSEADKHEWVLKNQGEGGGHCVFGEDISGRLAQLKPEEYDAWALMQRLYPHERDRPTLAVRDGELTQVDDLVSEIGLFTAYFNGEPVTELGGYAGYLVRSKPAKENEGGIHSGKGILDSITLID